MFSGKNAILYKQSVCVAFLLFILFSAIPLVCLDASAAGDRDVQLKRVAQEFLVVGRAQYKKQMFDAALVSLQKANNYRSYLTSSQQKELDDLLSKIGVNSTTSKEFDLKIQQADNYSAQGNYGKAKMTLEAFLASENLTTDMKNQISSKINMLDMQINSQMQQLQLVYNRSVSLYSQGNLVEARTGFQEIALTGVAIGQPGQTANDYLMKIDDALAAKQRAKIERELALEKQASENLDIEKELFELESKKAADLTLIESEQYDVAYTAPAPVQPARVAEISGSYIDKVNQQRRVQQSYTKAVVDDAIVSVQSFKADKDFENAKAKLLQAQAIVNKNKLALGEELYNEYATKLELLENQINAEMEVFDRDIKEARIIEGKRKAEQFRQQQEIERQKRIAELLENSRNFQKQQRYEEALKQVELLLAIDPLNDIALTTKMLLEDTITFRRQVEIRKEINKEEVGTYINVLDATIPYDEDVVYSKNWRELSARRAQDTVAGITKDDQLIYDQLDKIVDLSALNPETPLNEAVDILRNSIVPSLKIVVNWNDLSENAYIDQSTPINMDGIPAISLKKGLQLLLDSVSGGLADLVFSVEDGVVVVGTKGQIRVKLVNQVYDITELLLPRLDVEYDLGNISSLGGGTDLTGGGGSGDSGDTSFEDSGEDADTAREENVEKIIEIITSTIDPDSWYENGGEGNIDVFQENQLIVVQTPENQKQVNQLLVDLKKKFGMQVAIEARFLVVTESFLEDINFDMNVFYDFGGKLGRVDFLQNNTLGTSAINDNKALKVEGQYGDLLLDDLQVNFLLEATQQIANRRTLNAPKLTVLNGESASIVINKSQAYVGDYEFESITQGSGENSTTTIIADPTVYGVTDGVALNITPTISADRKYVILRIGTALSEINLDDFDVVSEEGTSFPISLPLKDSTTIMTRVSVPDQGTLLIGGIKVNSEIERERGVPVLNKIPGLKRLFSNSNQEHQQRVLLILVKPTIIIREEVEADAVSTLSR